MDLGRAVSSRGVVGSSRRLNPSSRAAAGTRCRRDHVELARIRMGWPRLVNVSTDPASNGRKAITVGARGHQRIDEACYRASVGSQAGEATLIDKAWEDELAMKRLAIGLGIMLLALVACGQGEPEGASSKPDTPTPTATATKTGPQLIIAEHAGQDEEHALNEACITFDANDEAVEDGSVSGLEALKRAYRDEVVTGKDDDGSGSVLCTLLGFGAEGCRSSKGKWMHYIVHADGKKVRATDDPTAYRIRSGEVDAWHWVKDGTEPYGIGTDFEEICDSA